MMMKEEGRRRRLKTSFSPEMSLNHPAELFANFLFTSRRHSVTIQLSLMYCRAIAGARNGLLHISLSDAWISAATELGVDGRNGSFLIVLQQNFHKSCITVMLPLLLAGSSLHNYVA